MWSGSAKAGWKDWEPKRVILEQDWVLVTRNSDDFRGPRHAPGTKGQHADVPLHAGILCLNGPVGMNLDWQRRLSGEVLDELDGSGDLTNQVLEVTLDDDKAAIDLIRYGEKRDRGNASYNDFDGKSIILFHVNPSDATPIGNQSRSPKVIVSFSGYKPPFDPEPIVRRMLDSVPKHYLAGLGEVVLSNAGGLSSKRRNISVKSRKRRVGLSTAIGLYHPASRGNSAWIEIFVDNAFRGWEEGWWLRVALVREGRLSDVLFHEIGHHIHRTVRPERREKEDVADVWKVRLQRNYNRQRFPWMGAIARVIQPVFGTAFLERQRQRLELRSLNRGDISRAEYLERVAKKTPRKLDIP